MLTRRDFIRAGVTVFCTGLPSLAPLNAAEDPIRLTASSGRVNLDRAQDKATGVMYYNESIPGPLLRIPQGRESVIRFRNRLDEPSSIHWHGLRIENSMDGVPGLTQAPVQPGEEFVYRLAPPDAGTYWYHSHMRSWAQQALGLAGVLIVEESDPPVVDRDLVLAFDDWRVDEAMQFDTGSLGSMHDWSHAGRLGNYLTVNGESGHFYRVSRGERLRLRLVNIANARIMNLLLGGDAMQIVAIDGQPVTPHAPQGGRLRLAPGQRIDLIADMTGDPGQRWPIEVVVREYAYEVSGLHYGDEVKRENLLDTPIAMAPNPAGKVRLPDEFQHVPMRMEGGAMGRMQSATYQGRVMGIRELVQQGKVWSINGIVDRPEQPLFRVPRGTAISLDIENDNNWPHAMHVHGHHFIDQRTPGIWRDTSLFERGERAALRFVADNPGKWLIHCHMTEHMAAGMVTWFEVT